MKRRVGTTKTLHQIQLPVSQLRLGMYVCLLDRPWLETPFLFQGFLLNDEKDLLSLRQLCNYVFIDLLKTHIDVSDLSRAQLKPEKAQFSYPVATEVELELGSAARHYGTAFSEIKHILSAVERGESFSTAAMIEAVRDCLDSVIRNPSALMWLTRIKHADQYTAEHCINVGIQAMTLGRHLGLGLKHLELLGLCGMLHDVGKMAIDPDILNKPDKLTAEEFEIIKQHAICGFQELNKDNDLPEEVKNVAYSHHERLDGKGYPRGLPAISLDFYTRVITIVDAYDAITSKRCYSPSNPSAAGLKIIYDSRGTQFDEALVVKFIECIGIYPPGTLVQMSTGEVGVVLSVDPAHRLTPRVALVLDCKKQPREEHLIVDLRHESSGPQALRVNQVLVDGSYGVDLEDFTLNNILMS
jgi:putative nucleotidyltransferase with HDIG domain